jgi:nitrite reductase (NADH) small subunit
MSGPDWTDVGALAEIPRRGARVLRAGGECIALFRTHDDRVYALEDRCPHKNGPLSQGIVHDARVTCPLHNWVIDLATGEATGADQGSVAVYSLKVTDGRVLIEGFASLRRRSVEAPQ